ncbi:MAG: NifB/NifX family molybdenum-iron cluster-binding protein [Anaerolineales bacterium]|jgi:predicted Fe-Mo cluster-binding NifX family protein
MRIAIAAMDNQGLDGQVSHHFGRCPYFVLVDVENNKIEATKIIENPFFRGHEPGMVPGFIREQNADVMISGGMGRRAIGFFQEYGVQAATGAAGTIRSALEAYLCGELPEAAPCRDSLQHHDHRGAGHDHKHGHHHEHE